MSGSWLDSASCREVDPELFFPRNRVDPAVGKAIAVCKACPVIRDCAQYRARIGANRGVWAGRLYIPRKRED